MNFIDACAEHSVSFLVYSSVDRGGSERSAANPTPVEAFASKHEIEKHLFSVGKERRMDWLVLRPTGLLEPLLRQDMIGKLGRTSWKVEVGKDKVAQWVSCKDIGHFAAEGFREPERWKSQCLSLAGWEGTFEQADRVAKEVTGSGMSVTFGLLSRFVSAFVVKDLGRMYKWMREQGFGADVQHLRELHPGLRGLRECLAS
jgi:nucleoside-diphosphate-sugar epimerase